MNIKQYCKEIEKTWINNAFNFERITFGICGESGEIAEKLKKYYRQDFDRKELINLLTKEIGDLFYYLCKLCNYFGLDPEKIFDENISKLNKRKEEDKIRGSGDNR